MKKIVNYLFVNYELVGCKFKYLWCKFPVILKEFINDPIP